MEVSKQTEDTLNKVNLYRSKVHRILAHSYAVYFIFFLFGVFCDMIFKFKILINPIFTLVGFIFLVFSTILIFWAQKTSRDLRLEHLSKETFCKGPYCYTRSPTHWGLFFLILGFGIISGAVFVILFTIIAFLISKFVFLDKEEAILAQKYGIPYLQYKKQVKL